MKKLTSLLIAGLLLLAQAGPAGAAVQNFVVSATVPLATGVSITASRVTVPGNDFTTISGTALNFDPLTFNSQLGIFLPNHYFAIDVGVVGAGAPDVTVTYNDNANPNSPGHGLGWKSTATFVKIVGNQETPLSGHGPKKMLKDLNGEHVTAAETAGAFLRMYVGIVTKDPSAAIPDPAASELFTAADKPGTYDGTLVISATVG